MRWIAVGAAVAVVAATAFAVAAASTTHGRARPKMPVRELVAVARSESSALGDPQVSTALVVATTKNAAEDWMEPGAIQPGPPTRGLM
jgi:hypothetical protein